MTPVIMKNFRVLEAEVIFKAFPAKLLLKVARNTWNCWQKFKQPAKTKVRMSTKFPKYNREDKMGKCPL